MATPPTSLPRLPGEHEACRGDFTEFFLYWFGCGGELGNGEEGAGQGEGLWSDSVSPLRKPVFRRLSLVGGAGTAVAAAVRRGELEFETGVERESSGVEEEAGEEFSRSSPLTMEEISVSSAPVCEEVFKGKSR